MFKIDDNLIIHITRGDIGTIIVTAENDDGTDYEFQVGDIVRIGVYTAKNMNDLKTKKDVAVSTKGTEVTINLEEEDTRIGDIINKPKDYWYEIELNPETNSQTIVGYDENGAKIFRLYPEGVEK